MYKIVIAARGPLPLTGSFDSTRKRVLMMVSGSAYAETVGTIGYDVLVNTKTVHKARFYANRAGTHISLGTRFVDVELDDGDTRHLVTVREVRAVTGDPDEGVPERTGTNGDDWFNVAVLGVPREEE